MKPPLFEVRELSKHFGGLKALDQVDFKGFPGEILGLVGPNGAGKTVCFNCLSGVYKPTRGRIDFNGERIDGLPPSLIARKGIGRTFQIVKPFTDLTVLENVLVARGINRYGRIGRIWSTWKAATEKEKALETLRQVGLADCAQRKAGLLPLGNLRRLEIARALIVGSRLLLLDESFSGLRAGEIAQLEELIRDICRNNITILLIEHNMRVTMELCERIVVLDHGRKIAEGVPSVIQQDERVIEAYLGRKRSSYAA